MKNRAQTRALAVIAITLAAALSACGSTGSSSSSASSTKSPSAASTNAASNDPNLVFAQCMRDKGFDGPWGVEILSTSFRALPVHDALKLAAESARPLLRDAESV